MKLFVEGGGNTSDLKEACRQAFREFVLKSGVSNKPKIIACGGRDAAFRNFRLAVQAGEAAMLLVDSEAPVAVECETGEPEAWSAWRHLQQRDPHWQSTSFTDADGHLMVQSMENWLLADRANLQRFFGQGFDAGKLPAATRPIEEISPEHAAAALGKASQKCKTKGMYHKGEHSFDLLAQTDPQLVLAASPWAKRFIGLLQRKMETA